MYIDALAYEYNCSTHTSTSVVTIELVLSKKPGPIALESTTSHEEPKGKLKCKWKHWLHSTMKKTKERLDEAQARYKNNYATGLRKQLEVIHSDDYVYVQFEQKNPKDNRRKLAPIVTGPLKVTKVD